MASIRQKLRALNLPNADSFNHDDEGSFRNLIVTVEDTLIRKYKVEDRGALRAIGDDSWNNAFNKYLQDLGCPFRAKDWQGTSSDRHLVLDWVLGRAIALEYSDKADDYNSESAKNRGKSDVTIDVDSHEVSDYLREIAATLSLPATDDMDLLWRAVSSVVLKKFSPSAITAAVAARKEVTDRHSLEDMPLGFQVEDPSLEAAAKVLRLLHVAELRDLQTQINEVIVAAQEVTADPRTDSRLGRVGK